MTTESIEIRFKDPQNKEHYCWWLDKAKPLLEGNDIPYNVSTSAGAVSSATNNIPASIEINQNDWKKIKNVFEKYVDEINELENFNFTVLRT